MMIFHGDFIWPSRISYANRSVLLRDIALSHSTQLIVLCWFELSFPLLSCSKLGKALFPLRVNVCASDSGFLLAI